MHFVGVDTGGTFTDFVYFNGNELITHKELSTPHAPEQAILKGLDALSITNEQLHMVHGSTVATNALLEAKGARTVFITNHGFKDLLIIGRQTRKELYNLTPKKERSLFDPKLNLETGGRMAPDSTIVEELTGQQLKKLVHQVQKLQPQAIAVCLLFSFIDSIFEKKIKSLFESDYFVSISSEVLAEHREYERGVATWLNSYLGPVMQSYLAQLGSTLPKACILVMQSHGLTLDTKTAEHNAVRLLLSGPAGGLWGSQHCAKSAGFKKLLTFDMGGTSTDVSLIDNKFGHTQNSKVAGIPIAVPMLDIHTIGAGGGSIAWIDEGGLLQVGPQSAGAMPGPACYGQEGTQATVTDANMVLGRIPPHCRLAGLMPLNLQAAKNAISCLAKQLHMDVESCAHGIIKIANQHMVQALRVMSIQRGYDPKEFTLVSFGGAGGLHVCELADSLQMVTAIVPDHCGVLSAMGLLIAPMGVERSRSYVKLLQDCKDEEVQKVLTSLQEEISLNLEDPSFTSTNLKHEVDVRYKGQSSCLKLYWSGVDQTQQKFHIEHKHRYGYDLQIPVELVNVRVTLVSDQPTISLTPSNRSLKQASPEYVKLFNIESDVPVIERSMLSKNQQLAGPAIILDEHSTTYVAVNWQLQQHESGALLLERMVES